MSNFFDNFYGTLFSPDKTFNELKENPPLFQAFLTVVIISALSSLLNSEGLWLLFNVIFAPIAGIISWLFFGAFMELIASIFKRAGHIKEFLALSGFALMPWVFTGIVELFKTDGIFGKVLGILIGLAIWLWAIVLLFMAIIKAYELSFGRVLTMFIVISISGYLTMFWVFNFFGTLFQILQ